MRLLYWEPVETGLSPVIHILFILWRSLYTTFGASTSSFTNPGHFPELKQYGYRLAKKFLNPNGRDSNHKPNTQSEVWLKTKNSQDETRIGPTDQIEGPRRRHHDLTFQTVRY